MYVDPQLSVKGIIGTTVVVLIIDNTLSFVDKGRGGKWPQGMDRHEVWQFAEDSGEPD